MQRTMLSSSPDLSSGPSSTVVVAMDNDLVVTENVASTGAKSGTVQQMMMQLLAMMLQPMPTVELLW
jgi:hypothetical protein